MRNNRLKFPIFFFLMLILSGCGLFINQFIDRDPVLTEEFDFEGYTKKQVYEAVRHLYSRDSSLYFKLDSSRKDRVYYEKVMPFDGGTCNSECVQFSFKLKIDDTLDVVYYNRFLYLENDWNSTKSKYGIPSRLLLAGIWVNDYFIDLAHSTYISDDKKKIVERSVKEFEKKVVFQIKDCLANGK